ncbi:ATP-binding protein [Kitasatospora sp. NPDC006697]|uniref:ATP-binding protein n=1 Tax=Kitasatospora sp. NPDC006697 TaxID=3364020 RepID=UPI0036A9B893
MRFGELLRELRRNRAWTQEELAERSGMSAHAISVLEAGRRRPRISSVSRLAEALALTAADRERLVAAARGEERGEERAQPAEQLTGRQQDVPAPRMLPYAVPDFTGRRSELDRLLALAAERGAGAAEAIVISAIDGMAGVGKTTLAVQAGHALADRYPDGQVFVDLHGFTPGQPALDPAAALALLLRAVGVGEDGLPTDREELARLWRSAVAERRLLVLLDNAADTAQVRPLIPHSPGSLVLITSRRRLAALAGSSSLSLDVLSAAEASALFTRIVGPERLAGHTAEVEEILALCGRLPLAVRITASRLAHRAAWTPAHLLERLRDEHRLLTLSVEDRSLGAAFAVSYQALNAEQRRVFRLAALHPGQDFTVADAAALVDEDPETVESLLEDLLDHHLLIEQRAGRFTFHDLLRRHARQAVEAEEPEEARRAALGRLLDHARYGASAAMDALYPHERHRRPQVTAPAVPLVRFAGAEQAQRWLAEELANLVACGTEAAAAGWPAHSGDLSTILFRFMNTQDHHTEARTLHEAAVRATATLPDRTAHARALTNLAGAHWQLSDYAEAADGFLLALEVFQAVGDRASEARVLTNLGATYSIMGRLPEAVDHHKRALAAFSEAGDRASQMIALNNLAATYETLGQYTEGLPRAEQCLALARELGDRENESRALCALGRLHTRLGDRESALRDLHLSLAIARETGLKGNECTTLNALGVCERPERPAVALDHHRESLRLAGEIGDRLTAADACLGMGDARFLLKDPDRARVHWQEALERFTELGAPGADTARARLTGEDRP